MGIPQPCTHRSSSSPGVLLCSLVFRIALFVLVFASQADAIKNNVRYPPLDDVWTFLAYDIGLAPGATINLNLTNERPANNTYVIVLTYAQWDGWSKADARPEALPTTAGTTGSINSYLASYWRKGIVDHIEASFKVDAPHNDRYYIGVLNAQQQLMKLVGTCSMVNPGGIELSLQEEKLPAALLLMAILFGVTGFSLIGLLCSLWRDGRSAIHALMVSVLLSKSMVLLLQWLDRMLVARSGEDKGFGQVAYQLLDKVQTILELMMFLLVSLGWKYLPGRNRLNITEVRFAIGISVISFYLGLFEVACTTRTTCSGYRLSRYILHSLCYLVVIVAMNFNFQVILHQVSESQANMEAGKIYQKLAAYKIFRWIFLAFIIAPTMELFLKMSMIPWDAVWVYIVFEQMRNWIIYVCVIVAFRPNPPSLKVFELTIRDPDNDEDDDWTGE